MSNLIEAMFNYGSTLLTAGLEGDADKQALQDNLVALSRARLLSQLQERDAQNAGAAAAGRIRMGASQLAGQQRLAFAAGNIDSTSGTAANVMASSRLFAELDAETAVNNARREALGHRMAQANIDQRTVDEVRGFQQRNNRRVGGVVGAGANVVGEALSFGMGG